MRKTYQDRGGKNKIAMAAPTAPINRVHKVIKDQQSKFEALTARTPVDQDFRDAFLRNKLLIAHTHPDVDLASRDRSVETLSAALGVKSPTLLTQPVPGGVGYGFFYTAPFKAGWGHGTSFAYDIVCPSVPGGNVNTWLYLTATNRSGKGVEAFVAYNGQGVPHFRVFDWARNDHWQTDCPFTALGNYLTTASAHGHPYQVLPVWNSTWLLSGSTYRNQVLLYNHVRGGWDLIYQFDYAATDAEQKNVWVGSWGPIVETFQPAYNQTNQLGVLATMLISADVNGQWGSWGLLSASNSALRIDNVGFRPVFVDPNYAFTVNS
jgi:hypothetical protein